MAQKTIFTVGFDLPTDRFEKISFTSNTSLSDADIILFKTSLGGKTYEECKKISKHWFYELKNAYISGKTIFIYMTERKIVKNYRHDITDSFSMLPKTLKAYRNVKGKKVQFTKDGNILRDYWKIAGDISSYELNFDFDITPLLETTDGHNIVGSYMNHKTQGVMFFLPPINIPDTFKNLLNWTDKAEQFGHNLAKEIIALDKAMKSNNELTPPPDWLIDIRFQLKDELKCLSDIDKIETEIIKLQEELESSREALSEATIPKKLLYETGTPLEKSIIYGLQVIGFKAENYEDAESEFDIVFESDDEGRFIGESEGKNSSAINVTKFRQLEANIQEDYAKEHVTDYAKGILFGNPYRLSHPTERTDCFTNKVQTSAKRSGIALVNTHELFEVVKYLLDTNDQDYAKEVRKCFKNISGEIIQFPDIPNI